MAEEQPATPEQSATPDKQLVLQKIYIKDLSFESPRAPEIFTENVTPQTQLNMRSATKDVGNDNIEVVLTLTVESKANDQTLFLIEVTQAGVFLIQGYTPEERAVLIGSFCPNTLYPFVREAIAEIVSKGGFPPLLLQPINFDALFAQAQREQAQAGAEAPPANGEPH